MECFYASRLERGHQRGATKVHFGLTNGLDSNYEYSNRDGHLTNSIEPADDVMTVVAVLWVALHTGADLYVVCLQSLHIHDL